MVSRIIIPGFNSRAKQHKQQQEQDNSMIVKPTDVIMNGSFRKPEMGPPRDGSETFALTPTSISSTVSSILQEAADIADQLPTCDLLFSPVEEKEEQDLLSEDEDNVLSEDEQQEEQLEERKVLQSAMKSLDRIRPRDSIQHTGERTIRLPNTDNLIKRKTCVRWDEKVRVRNVPPVSCLTETPEELWFQDHEFAEIKERIFLIIDVMETHELNLPQDSPSLQFLSDKICLRGLERHMAGKAEVIQERRYAAWDAVLDEQERQMANGFFNEQAMANAYKLRTMESKMDAVRVAQQDHKDIQVARSA